jgi:hypothetical protein
MTPYEFASVVVAALGLVGGVVGFFRSIVAGRRAAEAEARAADAQADAAAALEKSAAADERIAAALEAIARFEGGRAGPHLAGEPSSRSESSSASPAELAAELQALIPPPAVLWRLEPRAERGSYRLRNVGTVTATGVEVSGADVDLTAPVTVGPQSVLLVRAAPSIRTVEVAWRDAQSAELRRAQVPLD